MFFYLIFLGIRFSTEDVSLSTLEKKPKPTTPTPSRHRNSADWLGLKTNSKSEYLGGPKEVKASAEAPKVLSTSALEKQPLTGSQSTSLGKMTADVQPESEQSKSEAPKNQRRGDEEEDDWLAGALSRTKARSVSNTETKMSTLEDSLGVVSVIRYCAKLTQEQRYLHFL